MMEYIAIGLNIINVILWLVFIVYLLQNKKVVTINVLGIMLATSVIYPYIIIYDVCNNLELNVNLKYETLVCRILVIATFYAVVKNSKSVNVKLTKLSQVKRNLLEPK